MDMKIVGVVVAAFVSITVLAAVLMPILDDATDTEDTFTNDGLYHMTKYGTDTEIEMIWSYEKPNVITVNDVDIPIDSMNIHRTVLFGDSGGARVLANNSGCQILFSTGTSAASVSDEGVLTVTCSSGTMTAVIEKTGQSPATTNVGSYTDLYCISTDGPYVMKSPNKNVYIKGDSEVHGFGVTNVTGAGNLVLDVVGTIDDGVTVTSISNAGASTTFSTPTITATPDSNYKDLYSLEKITFVATASGNDTNVTYSYFLVPYEVTAEKAEHLTTGQIELLDVIPILVIVAILLGVIALVIRSRLD